VIPSSNPDSADLLRLSPAMFVGQNDRFRIDFFVLILPAFSAPRINAARACPENPCRQQKLRNRNKGSAKMSGTRRRLAGVFLFLVALAPRCSSQAGTIDGCGVRLP
jgi:hypothetical protein